MLIFSGFPLFAMSLFSRFVVLAKAGIHAMLHEWLGSPIELGKTRREKQLFSTFSEVLKWMATSGVFKLTTRF